MASATPISFPKQSRLQLPQPSAPRGGGKEPETGWGAGPGEGVGVWELGALGAGWELPWLPVGGRREVGMSVFRGPLLRQGLARRRESRAHGAARGACGDEAFPSGGARGRRSRFLVELSRQPPRN